MSTWFQSFSIITLSTDFRRKNRPRHQPRAFSKGKADLRDTRLIEECKGQRDKTSSPLFILLNDRRDSQVSLTLFVYFVLRSAAQRILDQKIKMTKRLALTNLFLLALAALCIAATLPFAMYDQGDFARMVSRVVSHPFNASSDFPAMDWEYYSGTPVPNLSSGLASVVFWLAALVQRMVFNHFSLVAWGGVAKMLMAMVVMVLTHALADGRKQAIRAHLGFGIALILIAFAPHNSAFFQTFYPEQIALVALPLLCATFVGRFPGRGVLFAASLMALAWTKTQYFYTPILVLAILWIYEEARPMPIKTLIMICVVTQAIAILPIARSAYTDANRYNATYFGSYLALDSDERADLHLSSEQLACIGTDWWGNRIESPIDVEAEPTSKVCGETLKVSQKDVVVPFLHHPTLFFRMVADTMQVHWTTRYFHIDKDNRYLRVDPRRDGLITKFMLVLDKLVSILASPLAVLILLLSAPLLAVRMGRESRWVGACVFLGGFIVSQLVVSLLGEGFRDLSKHLALMLFASELLAIVTLAAWLENQGRVQDLTEGLNDAL